MPATTISPEVTRAVARNVIGRGPFLLVSFGADPVLLQDGVTYEHITTALDLILQAARLLETVGTSPLTTKEI